MTEIKGFIAALDVEWHGRYPVRITKKQKEQFLQEWETELHARNFTTSRIVARKLLRCTNLDTDCENPRVIFMAHYDTPSIIPFWFSWLFRLIGHTRQILALVLLVGLLVLVSLLLASVGLATWFHLLIFLSLLTLFIPNPHNREDNTSGVIGLMALADWLHQQPALQNEVQLLFLDNEEWGLLGSGALKQVWQKQGHPYQNAVIINLDCISRGQTPLLIYHRNGAVAERLRPYLQKHLPPLQIMDMGPVPLSDNYTFGREGAVDISYADPTLIPGGYYIPRIHTPADNDFFPDKLQPLLQGLTDFLQDELID
ncbi:MAG: M28 family peptidase [Chloroflexi bacterium]|nr:M28 family peptidase [Ardenticatenaceae bacterium]MBL1130543.1 M28 family peptidase [Chloroflexota bacterium]NOG36633.1 M28 family peptidase [Chloroflexota bacterium]GIK56734.1 MAG: hypothetical protein BroJett015_23970 [Chloroflexota bacterium]